MALAAAQAIDALAARLVPLAATAGRVYTSRGWPITEAELPAWRVLAADESVERVGTDGLNQHLLTVEATACARAVANLDDTLHALASGGLALLFAGTPPYDLALLGLDRLLSGEAEAAMGAITLRLQCRFFVYPAAPDTLIS